MRKRPAFLALTAIGLLLLFKPAIAGQPVFKPSGRSAEWWYVGRSSSGGDYHFIDGFTVKKLLFDAVNYQGMSSYLTPFVYTDDTGQRRAIAYEEFIRGFQCDALKRYSHARLFYGADRQLIITDRTDYPPATNVVESTLSGLEYAFVCRGERAGGSHGFRRIYEDPVTYRGQ